MSAHATRTTQIGSAHTDVRRALAVKRGQQPGRLLIDGVWAHRAAVDAGAQFDTAFSVPELLHSGEADALLDLCRSRAGRSYRISGKIIERLSDRHQPDGLISIIEQPRWNTEQLGLPDDALIVVADGLQSPGNLGTVIRTIDACRADLLIVTNTRARPDGDKVFQGSRGLSLTVPQLLFERPSAAVDWLQRRAVSIMVADANRGLPYPLSDLRGPVALVIGNERHGVSPDWSGFDRIRIPMLGRADSLNVAVSAGVLLYHARAQRDAW
ncbi:TrmH family RNA methyltransferase [Microlunatus soli]|uniref:RNA methyltransferase, TrmH family n=1 Tax=Microlunatus soli TaxID=630515 RepID=A0A1H1YQ65_9ACTN|nr:RNA methyltransferase [Microlunatus soli]SDT23527.1 RNA methyltransferase, TrmH family [Microlunatus soli]